jgi:hypothetical protein
MKRNSAWVPVPTASAVCGAEKSFVRAMLCDDDASELKMGRGMAKEPFGMGWYGMAWHG